MQLPWKFHSSDPNWVPPIRHNQKELVTYKKHPFYDNAEIETFLATRDGEVVGYLGRIHPRLAADLEAMGPTFVKLGQLMSSRVDLISPAYVEALSRLQDDVEPFGLEQVEDIVSSELQVRLRSVYAEFDPVPIAAASIGQVHRARLRDGREVVVKVQRPGVRERIRDDMEVLADLAALLDRHTDAGRRFGFADLLEEFRKVLVDELDYRREADNLARVRELVAGRDLLVVPAPVPELTTGRVLTMEYVEGRKITDIGPLGRMDLDGAALADELFAAYLDQVLDQGVFHADPHPGNFRVVPGVEGGPARLGVLDFGAVARLDGGFPPAMGRLLSIAATRSGEDLVDALREEGFIKDRIRVEPDLVRDYLLPFVEPATTETFQFSREWMRGVFAKINDPRDPAYTVGLKLNLPPSYLLIHRTWLGGLGILSQLEAEAPFRQMLLDHLPGFSLD